MQESAHPFISISPTRSVESVQYRSQVTTTLFRPIKLLYYHAYEPADSDSSGPELIQSEPNSNNEEFIDNNKPAKPNLSPSSVDPSLPPDEIADLEESTAAEKDVNLRLKTRGDHS